MPSSSTLTRIVATTRAEVERALAGAPAGAAAFLHFSGAVDAATGASWCGDCIEAEPVLRAAFAAAAAERPLLIVYVPLVRAEFKGVASHWARAAPFGVARIPTLARWGRTKVTAALIEDECKDGAAVAALLAGE